MFEGLTQRLEGVFRRLRSRGKLGEADIAEALREIRLALLEADVHFKVVKDFISGIRERALGAEVIRSLSPGQQVVKIVNEKLTELMGGSPSALARAQMPPTVILLAGLQGSGKTTTAAKLALRYQREGNRPFLVPTDVHRPAAIEQLKILGKELGVGVYDPAPGDDPVAIADAGLAAGRSAGAHTVIVDTAGRLQIDEPLMEELRQTCERVSPDERLLVADAMTGQEAVKLAEAFHKVVHLTGVILTKMDGDARGGAALSIRAAVGIPIKFIGVGEKSEALELFHPARVASRILGMGDVLGLIERAEATVSAEEATAMALKVRKEQFTLEDFKDQLHQIRRMGPLEDLLGMIPGVGKLPALDASEQHLTRTEAIISSMTPKERAEPALIDGSRRQRIARGSGTTSQDINQLLKQFAEMNRMMKLMTRGTKGKQLRNLQGLIRR